MESNDLEFVLADGASKDRSATKDRHGLEPRNDAKAMTSAGRRRSPATGKAIKVAILSLLKRENYNDISIERIAAKARVSKHSIYRRWTSKGEVILDAFLDYALQRAAPADLSDDAFADLERFIVRAYQAWRDPLFAKGLRGLTIEMSFDRSLRRRFDEAYLTSRRSTVERLIGHGIECGQFRADVDRDAVVEALFGFIWFHLSFDVTDLDEPRAAAKLMAILRPYLQNRP